MERWQFAKKIKIIKTSTVCMNITIYKYAFLWFKFSVSFI